MTLVPLRDLAHRVRQRADREVRPRYGLSQMSADETERFAREMVDQELAFTYAGQVNANTFDPQSLEVLIEAAYETAVLRLESIETAVVVVSVGPAGVRLINLFPP